MDCRQRFPVQIHRPHSHQQIRFTRTLSSSNSFVAFVDAVGELNEGPNGICGA